MLNFIGKSARFDSQKELPGWLSGTVVLGVAALLLVGEFRRALRLKQREPKARRNLRNLAIAAGAGMVMHYAERPIALSISKIVSQRNWGLAPFLTRNRTAQTLIAVAMLDYGLYIWHVLTHKVPFLWRFHLVHHIDLDLDASTALRFHFGEMLLSVPWRAMQIAVSGASPLALSIWQTSLFASILFHHSNLRLPTAVERVLSFLIATPKLHGIHHHANPTHANSNWSSGLAIWDLLHGTWRDTATVGTIGVPAYQHSEDVTFLNCAVIPFSPQRDDWAEEVPQR
jgi:sterol desaturase/sphingolipid hydroxylase (fatty acid hydroxylase superfamily)